MAKWITTKEAEKGKAYWYSSCFECDESYLIYITKSGDWSFYVDGHRHTCQPDTVGLLYGPIEPPTAKPPCRHENLTVTNLTREGWLDCEDCGGKGIVHITEFLKRLLEVEKRMREVISRRP